MKTLDALKKTKIKRKNFLYLTGLFAAGAFIIAKVPFGILRKNKGSGSAVNGNLKPVINPEAVKRDNIHGKKTKGV